MRQARTMTTSARAATPRARIAALAAMLAVMVTAALCGRQAIALDSPVDQASAVLLGRVVRIERWREHGNEGHHGTLFGYYALIEIGQVVKGAGFQPGGLAAVRVGGYWAVLGQADDMVPTELQSSQGGKPLDLHANDVVVGFFAAPDPAAEPPGLTAPVLQPLAGVGLARIVHDAAAHQLIVHPLGTSAELDGLKVDDFAKRTGIVWTYPPQR